jgi:hypothetical protein
VKFLPHTLIYILGTLGEVLGRRAGTGEYFCTKKKEMKNASRDILGRG